MKKLIFFVLALLAGFVGANGAADGDDNALKGNENEAYGDFAFAGGG